MVFNESIRYEQRMLMIDEIAVNAIVAAAGTPSYVYSLNRILENYQRLSTAFAPLAAKLRYSVKANGNLDILRALARAGAGFDCVSGGEIWRALKAGAKADDIVFAGVGKTRAEIDFAVGRGVGWLNVENLLELEYIQAAAEKLGVESVRVALRFNPEVAADTHPHIATGHGAAKFGLTAGAIRHALGRRNEYPAIAFAGVHFHIGSQLGDISASLEALRKTLELIRPYPDIRTVNIGGGLPVAYRMGEDLPSIDAFVRALAPRLKEYAVLLEPGRSLVADAGILLSEVLYVKEQAGRLFYIVDASMTELLRPALYGAFHEIVPLRQSAADELIAQVVGPVCESTDLLARDRALPRLQVGDQIAFMTAGAYGMVMSSNYNARPRPAEVLVDGGRWWLSRRRETYEDLVRS